MSFLFLLWENLHLKIIKQSFHGLSIKQAKKPFLLILKIFSLTRSYFSWSHWIIYGYVFLSWVRGSHKKFTFPRWVVEAWVSSRPPSPRWGMRRDITIAFILSSCGGVRLIGRYLSWIWFEFFKNQWAQWAGGQPLLTIVPPGGKILIKQFTKLIPDPRGTL